MTEHFVGKKISENQFGRFFGSFNDKEFELLMNKLDGKLPKGFVVWHIEPDELKNGSKRIDKIKELPLLTEFNPYSIDGRGYADAEKALTRAREYEELDK